MDETGEFPQASYDALRAADFHAPHIPEEYGGAGADALATVIVIEEVARVCASSSLIPAVNKLGTLPLLLSGSEELKRRYLPPVAAGDAMFSYCLSEPEAGSDAAGDEDPGGARRRPLGAQRRQALDHQRRASREYYTVFAVTDPTARSKGISAFVVEKSDDGVSFGAPEKKLGIKGSPTREVYLDNVRIPADRMIGGRGHRLRHRDEDPGPHPGHHRRPGASASPRARWTTPRATSRSASSSARPIADFQGVQFMLADMAMKLEAARQLTYAAAAKSERGDADLTFFGAAAKCFASDVAMEITTDAVQLLGGYGYTRTTRSSG